jgi:hypothetical protein
MLEEADNNRGQIGKVILLFAVILILIGAVYFTFFFTYSCDSLACFQAHQRECSRTHFINQESDTVWDYKIVGEENKACQIEVKVLQVKQGETDRKKLEGESMTCYLPFGSDKSPESDISVCHGLLKEELQGMIIEKLHLYVVENIGEIGNELTSV